MAIPERELLASAIELRSTSMLVTLLIVLLSIPVTWLIARAIARPLRALAAEADAIRHFEFSRPIKVKSMIKEVDELALTMGGMKRAIRRFLDISGAVAEEKNFDLLMPLLLSEMLVVSGAKAGLLYLASDNGLVPAAARDSKGVDLMSGLPQIETGASGTLLAAALQDSKVHSGVLQDCDHACHGTSHEWAGISATHGLAVPLINRQRQLVGAMLLLRDTEMEDAQVSFVQAISGTVAGVLETRELISAQQALFEAFIQMIAGAIDAKSPYTGGHCARVPELTKMLARAACAQSSGPFADFQLDEEQWEAVHVASWLHDCGKITTPEYVVDKATKLETIYDRIHEVRMRFEVLKRDAEIACLKAIAAGEPGAAAQQRLVEEWRRLDEDFAFVASCNEGGEFMAAEKMERLKAIAGRTWLRTLDDRIGISHDEKVRKGRTPAAALPVTETLLADRPEHLLERRAEERIGERNKWGFRIKVPELLYNRGELHNLLVARGTLSEEERYKINEHMVQTVIMLGQLPFPKHLRSVPEIAGGHHEKMDGTGYPKRLTRDEMSPVARMMAIADIFEALTAADRPYKKAKPLSEAIRIMGDMKKNQHIDPELFDLFLRSGVYMQYARQYLSPEQIDEVDVSQYLTQAVAA
jgi:HD-GYP domain-containing protein (c-di-GMP phosphodiesterase class II)/HAMP domain-containing protein